MKAFVLSLSLLAATNVFAGNSQIGSSNESSVDKAFDQAVAQESSNKKQNLVSSIDSMSRAAVKRVTGAKVLESGKVQEVIPETYQIRIKTDQGLCEVLNYKEDVDAITDRESMKRSLNVQALVKVCGRTLVKSLNGSFKHDMYVMEELAKPELLSDETAADIYALINSNYQIFVADCDLRAWTQKVTCYSGSKKVEGFAKTLRGNAGIGKTNKL